MSAHDDQIDAAAREAAYLLHRLAEVSEAIEPDRRWSGPRSGGMTPDARSIIIEALRGAEGCPHLTPIGPQPAIAMLAVHAVDCAPCSGQFRWPPPDEDDRCDWCGAREVDTFRPVVIQVGPLLVIGDACPACWSVLELDQAAA